MASGDKVYVADKATQDLIKQDTTAILDGVNNFTDDLMPLSDLITGLYQQNYEFTASGEYIITVPPNAVKAKVTACGAGGGGGGGATGTYSDSNGSGGTTSGGGGGGGGAAVFNQLYDVTTIAGTTIKVTVGEKGIGGSGGRTQSNGYEYVFTPATNGTAGGSTIIQNIVTLPGGKGGGGVLTKNSMGSAGARGGTGGGAGGKGGYSRSGIAGVAGSAGALGAGGAINGNYGGGGGGSIGDGNSGTKGAGGFGGNGPQNGSDGSVGYVNILFLSSDFV